MHYKAAYPMFIVLVVTLYLALATTIYHEGAASPADQAAVKVLTILTGALAIVVGLLAAHVALERSQRRNATTPHP